MIINLLIALYPATWRERYEDEFRAMLELCNLTVFDLLDIAFTATETRLLETRGKLMKDMLNRTSALIALISVITLFIGIVIVKEEDTSEFLFMISPVLSLAMIPALHRVLNSHAPHANRIIKWMGFAAIGVFSTAFLIGFIIPPAGIASYAFGLMFCWLIGLWLIGVNILSMRTRVLSYVHALPGIIAGLAWIYVMTVSIVFSATGAYYLDYPAIISIQNIAIVSLIFGYGAWAIGLAYLLFTGTLSRKLQVVY